MPRTSNASFCSRALTRGMVLLVCEMMLTTGRCAPLPEKWEDITSGLVAGLTNGGVRLDWPGGCSGVAVNRTNGAVTVKVVGQGLWRSLDKGANWRRIDDNVVSGRDETGWATSVDQEHPGRLASFSLDGSAGWTPDGNTWRAFASLGRNWDFGSVNWSAAVPKTIIAARHETEPPGEVYVTDDAGLTWRKLTIHLSAKRDRISMIGALDVGTFVYSTGSGILRSKDGGQTWTRVSTANPQTRIPVLFRGIHYLGSANGLLVSRDKGLSWKPQGSAVNIWQGPFFGQDEKQMMIVGDGGIFLTRDAGETWNRVAGLKAKEKGFLFTPNWFGCYAWDPVNNIVYASAMGNPVYRLQL